MALCKLTRRIAMNINIRLADKTNYTAGRIKTIRYLVIHYTANNGDTALGNCKYFQGKNRNSSAHYFVDENEIYQSVKDSDTAWHCGAKKFYHKYCRNNNSIGIELCSRKDVKWQYYFKDETIKNAVDLTRYLMKKYDIKIENIIRHYDVTHKICPEPFVRDIYAWDNFKKLIVNSGEVSEVKKTIDVVINGKNSFTEGYFADGRNLFTVDFIRQLGFEVGYDEKTKQVIINPKELQLNVDGKNMSVETVNIAGSNFCSIRSMAEAVGRFEVAKYENGIVYVNSK